MIKKTVLFFSIFTLLLVLTACGQIENPTEIKSSLSKKGIELTDISLNTYYKLGIENGLEKAYKAKNNDEILVYVFTSNADAKGAKEQFETQFAISKIAHTPTFYVADNVFVAHLSVSANDNFSKTFEEALHKILPIE